MSPVIGNRKLRKRQLETKTLNLAPVFDTLSPASYDFYGVARVPFLRQDNFRHVKKIENAVT
ncbi:MAG: hypothetical protein D8M57_10195 [Candidatus Scalindua sp. AMX11]|nr:MAG: hypothetical protein DWQ00_01330 [Candidatus Scalindua sp.]TDE64960.1 MAG: hypothetical protein D8M57_10195 [Candidatus Scalindua sp. AMX11]